MKEKINKFLKYFVSGGLAGFFISFGGLTYILCNAYIKIDSGLAKFIGALAFTVGLFFICIFSLLLYTGKIGYVIDKEEDKFKKLIITIISNCLVAFAMGCIYYVIFKNNSEVMNYLDTVVAQKNNFLGNNMLSLELLIKGFLCGVCVFIATYIFKKSNTTLFKFLGIIIPIFLFVFLGFEHCIANVFFDGFAMEFSWQALCNFLLVLVGNSLGSITFNALFKYIEVKVHDKDN